LITPFSIYVLGQKKFATKYAFTLILTDYQIKVKFYSPYKSHHKGFFFVF